MVESFQKFEAGLAKVRIGGTPMPTPETGAFPGSKESSPVGQRLSDLVFYSLSMTTKTHPRVEQQLSEIDGYLELGMQEEALAQVRITLNRPLITPEEFGTCVFALLQMDRPEPWRKAVENAYGRLKGPINDKVRSAMLNYYFSIGKSKMAFEFFPRRWTKFFDAWVMMQVCLELGRLDRAKAAARICSEVLSTAKDDFTRASMTDALASYHARLGNCDAALKLWEEAPDEPTFQRQRLCGIVKVHLIQALEATRAGLASVAANRQRPDLSNEIQLPGNNAALASDTECELNDLERAIARLLQEPERALSVIGS